MFLKNEKIFIVAAHPDDEIIGMGGTLKKIAKNNFVKILFLADGITARKQGGFENSSKYETTENEKNIMFLFPKYLEKFFIYNRKKGNTDKCTKKEIVNNKKDNMFFSLR